ncbi:hypothetical protein MtrunA17_Chr4g0054061 [Medicago truncatula]|uniref:Uncharacterized protein n=1 Tax=Medicago truncatula TaxID=3880 RepID=G7JE21_MEDTR|nr:hypothetical protein MTR_4g097030 [Medicago truncatula]RHN63045.1 hypothetical protein MtrunA17_Chr4g0054061 [Medicago truncatula]
MAEEELNNGYCSSSGDEDGDAAWKAAIDSVAGTSSYVTSFMNGFSATNNNDTKKKHNDNQNPKSPKIKHYQLKALKLLDDILENTIEIVKEPIPVLDEDPNVDDCGIRLFRHSKPGIVFDHADEPQPPMKRPKLVPGEDIDEKSKKFRRRIRSIAVDGNDLIAAANDAYKKSLARLEAKDAAAKAKAKREEERIEKLKKIRGERWLPSMAKEMQAKIKIKH